MLSVAFGRFPWLSIGFALIGGGLLVAGGLLHQDLYGRDLITAAITLAVVRPTHDKDKE